MSRPREEFLELTGQAREALQAGDVAGAIEKYLYALGASFSEVPEDLRILVRLGLADAFRMKGELATSAELTEKARSDALRSYGEQSALHAEALNDAGVQKHYEGDLAAARDYYERAIKVFSQIEAPAGWYAACLVNLGTLLSRHFQEFARATELFERAVEILGDDPDTAHYLYAVMEKLALHYHELSYHDERTISLLREVLEYKSVAYGADAIATADTLALLGRCFEQAGDYASALSSLIEARRIYAMKLPVTDVRYANVCRYLGSVRSRLDNFAAAEALFREADSAYRVTLGEFHPWALDNRLRLAQTLGAQGRTDEEAELYNAVVEGYKQQYGERSRDFAQALHNRGTRRMETGDLDGAAEDLARARKLRAEILGTGAYDYAITLNSEGMLLAKRGDLDQATRTFRNSIDILDRLGVTRHPTYALVLSNLAIHTGLAGELRQAMDLTDRAIAVDLAAIRSAYVIGAQRSRLGLTSRLQAQLMVCVALTALSGTSYGPPVSRAWSQVLRYRAQEYELETGLALTIREQGTSEFARTVKEIRALELEATTLQARATRTATGEDIALRQLLSRIDGLALHAWRESPFGAKADLGQEISEEALAAALSQNEALLEFVGYVPLGEEQSPQLGCFVVRRGQPTQFKTVAPLGDVLDAVDAFVRGLLGDRWKNRFTPRRLAERDAVRRLVLEPLLPWLEEVSHLVVCGEGGVERLPFDLLGDAGGSSLATWTVTYAAVARDVVRRPAAPGHARGAVFAAPIYAPASAAQTAQDTTRTESPLRELRQSSRLFRDLKGSREEGEFVASLTGADLYQDEAASKETLGSMTSPAFLHFATHGFYLPMAEPQAPDPVMVSLIDHPMYRCGLA